MGALDLTTDFEQKLIDLTSVLKSNGLRRIMIDKEQNMDFYMDLSNYMASKTQDGVIVYDEKMPKTSCQILANFGVTFLFVSDEPH